MYTLFTDLHMSPNCCVVAAADSEQGSTTPEEIGAVHSASKHVTENMAGAVQLDGIRHT